MKKENIDKYIKSGCIILIVASLVAAVLSGLVLAKNSARPGKKASEKVSSLGTQSPPVEENDNPHLTDRGDSPLANMGPFQIGGANVEEHNYVDISRFTYDDTHSIKYKVTDDYRNYKWSKYVEIVTSFKQNTAPNSNAFTSGIIKVTNLKREQIDNVDIMLVASGAHFRDAKYNTTDDGILNADVVDASGSICPIGFSDHWKVPNDGTSCGGLIWQEDDGIYMDSIFTSYVKIRMDLKSMI